MTAPESQPVPIAPDPEPDPAAPRASDSIREGIAWGLAAGVGELIARQSYWAIRPRVTVESIRTNRHHLWMVPASDLLVLGGVGVALAIAARFAPKSLRFAGTFLLAALAALCVARVADQLHSASGLVLAGGFGAFVARRIAAREPLYRRALRRSTLPLLALFLLWTGGDAGRVLMAERMAVDALPPPPKAASNVLLVVMDNVRADDLSLYGYDRDTTPNLKRLAARGVRFDRARSTASWTLPSHASMLTGRWPHELSVTVDTPLDDEAPTLAERLAARGYVTAGFVANTYYCNAWYGLDRGFSRYEDFAANREVSLVELLRCGSLGKMFIDKFRLGIREWPGDPSTRKTAARVSDDFLSWMDRRGDRPFFAFLNYYDAHAPFQPPEGSPRRFGLSRLPEPDRMAILRAQRDMGEGRASMASKTQAERVAITERAATLLRDSYDDCIASLDAQVGRLMDELERRGVLDDTLVILTSDHGEEFGEHTLFGHGVSVYRPEVHVPLLILPPRRLGAVAVAHRGAVVTQPTSLREIPATVLDLVGSGGASPFPGESLARLWTDPGARPGVVLSEVEHQTKFAPSPTIPASLGPISSIFDGRYAYIRNADGREEVYDVESDPSESRNLAGEAGNRATLARLRGTLDALGGTDDAPARTAASKGDPGTVRR